MKIECLHGYFKFTELKAGDVSMFASLFDLEIEMHPDGFFTFPFLLDAPKYSIQGSTYLNAPAAQTFEGEAWDVMRENGLVYNFVTDTVVPLAQVTTNVKLIEVGSYFVSSGLILPGSLTPNGSKIVGYSGFYLRDFAKFKYSVVDYV